jgi:hypothetical protein
MSALSFTTLGVLITLNSVDFNLPSLTVLFTSFGVETNYNGFGKMYYQETFPNIAITLTIIIGSPFLLNCADILIKLCIQFYD